MTVEIHIGDCLDVLRTLPQASVHCCVTSPPYYGLRDYGVDGQIGLEETPAAFIEKMVAVFREVRRVLRDDGTCWVNMGDSYATAGGGGVQGTKGEMATRAIVQARDKRIERGSGRWGGGNSPAFGTIKPKDMMGMPWRLAFALQDDGWYLRQDIIWSKPNPMPESVTDRCTKAHEYIFLLSKSARYYFDQGAITEEVSPNTHARMSQDLENQIGSARAHAGGKTNGKMKAVTKGSGVGWGYATDEKARTKGSERGVKVTAAKSLANSAQVKNNVSFAESVCLRVDRRNKRSVWEVTTQPFKEAHFATFPPKLIEPCVLAGCPRGGMVLDPFFGAGTTGLVADRHQRNCIGIELNPQYAKIALQRLQEDAGIFSSFSTYNYKEINV